MTPGPEEHRIEVGQNEWANLLWAIQDSDDERVRQAWDQAVSSAKVVPVEHKQ